MADNQKINCDHCGKKECEDCIKYQGKNFCCENCCKDYKKQQKNQVHESPNVCKFC